MKFHTPSFLMGCAGAVAVVATGKRLRPAIVEIGSLLLHLGRLGRGVVERQREHAEDLWAEVEERARLRSKGRRKETGRRSGDAAPNGASPAGATTH